MRKYGAIGLLVIIALFSSGSNAAEENLFSRIENDLIISNSLADRSDPDFYKSQPKLQLTVRMAFYKVPAVNI